MVTRRGRGLASRLMNLRDASCWKYQRVGNIVSAGGSGILKEQVYIPSKKWSNFLISNFVEGKCELQRNVCQWPNLLTSFSTWPKRWWISLSWIVFQWEKKSLSIIEGRRVRRRHFSSVCCHLKGAKAQRSAEVVHATREFWRMLRYDGTFEMTKGRGRAMGVFISYIYVVLKNGGAFRGEWLVMGSYMVRYGRVCYCGLSSLTRSKFILAILFTGRHWFFVRT